MFHTIIIAGNLGRDPELRYTTSGQAVVNFSVATSRSYQDSNGQQIKETIWFRVTAWGKLAETCNQYLKKGAKVIVEGRLKPDLNTGGPRIWTRQDGTPAASFEVTAQTVRFISSRAEAEAGYPHSETLADPTVETDENDIPF